jgi:chaperonin GroEL
VEVTNKSTKIIDGLGAYSAIVDWVKSIRVEIEVARTESEQEFHRERIAKLAGGIAHVKICASSEIDLTEKKATLKNCIAKTTAAIKNGEIETTDQLKIFIEKTLF